MDLKSIWTPRRVYEGWFDCYFIRPWIVRYADFHTPISGHGCLMSLLAWLIMTIGLAGLLMGLVGLLGPDTGFACLEIIGIIWLAASVVPFIALMKRAMEGQRRPDEVKVRHPKFLLIDLLQALASILFFVFGLFMMTTTLNSEFLHPDPGIAEEGESVIKEEDVADEPIFTYQSDAPVSVEQEPQQEEPDPDMVSPEESFDPTIAPTELPDEAVPDSLYF